MGYLRKWSKEEGGGIYVTEFLGHSMSVAIKPRGSRIEGRPRGVAGGGNQKCAPFIKRNVKNAHPQAERRRIERRPRGVRGGWGSKKRTLRQKVRQKGDPLGRKSSFGMELSRPQGPPFPPERNAVFAKSNEFSRAFCDMSDLTPKRRGVGEK